MGLLGGYIFSHSPRPLGLEVGVYPLPCFSLLFLYHVLSLLSEKSALLFMLSDHPNPYFYGPPGHSLSSLKVFSAWLKVTFSRIIPVLILVISMSMWIILPLPWPLSSPFHQCSYPPPGLSPSLLAMHEGPPSHFHCRDSIIRNPLRMWEGTKV